MPYLVVLTVLEKTGAKVLAKVSDFYVVLQKLEINSIFHFSPPLTNDIVMSAGPAQPPPPQPPAPVKPWKFLEPPPQWLFSKEVSCVRSNVASCGIFFFDKIVKTILVVAVHHFVPFTRVCQVATCLYCRVLSLQ